MATPLNKISRQTSSWFDQQVLQPGLTINKSGVTVVNKYQTGTTVDDFRAKIRDLRDATSSYEVERVWTKNQRGYYCCKLLRSREPLSPGWETWTTNQFLTGVSPPSLSKDSRVDGLAYGRFLKNVSDQLAPFKGLTFLGELRDSVKMLRRPLSSLRDGMMHYTRRALTHRSNWKKGLISLSEANKALTGTWLEYSLGWLPLVGSINDAHTALIKLTQDPKLIRVYGKFEDEISGSSSTQAVLPDNSDRFYSIGTTVTITVQKSVYKGVFKYRPDREVPDTRDFHTRMGLTIQEFVPTVWELIPYSFVVDYFTNIGDVANYASVLTLNWVYRSASFKQTTTITKSQKMDVVAMGKTRGNILFFEFGSKPSVNEFVHYKRWTPSLGLPSVHWRVNLNPWRWATLYSLLTQQAHKVVKSRNS